MPAVGLSLPVSCALQSPPPPCADTHTTPYRHEQPTMHTLTRHRQSKRAQAQTEKGTGGTGGTDESVLLIHARARRRAGAGAQAGKQGSRPGSRPVRAETLAYQHRQAAQEECRTPALQRQRLAHQPPRQPRPSLLAPRAPAQRRGCSTHCAAHWRLVHHHQHQRHPHPALPSAYLRSHPPLGLG